MFVFMTTESTKKFRVWIGDLHDYTNGVLRGKWITLSDETTVESLQSDVNAMLAEADDSYPHSEYFFEYENIPLSSEYYSFEALLKVASLVRVHGSDIVRGFIDWAGIEAIEAFEDAFLGVYSSLEAYAHEFIHACYDLDKMLGALASYFDYGAFARDLDMGGDIFYVDVTTADGVDVAIFNSRF
jgi:antirestriction protein